jgi:hypothetical protein
MMTIGTSCFDVVRRCRSNENGLLRSVTKGDLKFIQALVLCIEGLQQRDNAFTISAFDRRYRRARALQ